MKVFIACSARDSVKREYLELASDVSTMLAKRGEKLVFGGWDEGMMEKCFMTFKYEGAKTKAVGILSDAERIENMDVDARDIVPTTFDRTKRIYECSDLIVILPGGIGTLAEFTSMIDFRRVTSVKKPIVLFNYNDFYTPLINYLKEMYEKNFVNKNDLKEFNIVNNIDGLEFYIKQLELEGEI